MRIKALLLLGFVLIGLNGFSQKVYNETIDAKQELDKAILRAEKENKHVLAIVGGNWCKWCLMFDEFTKTNEAVKQAIEKDYIIVKVNWSKDNKNPEAMKVLDNPKRFGFPVFVVLDQKGKRLHTQNSAYLEKGEGYNEKEVINFLNHWNFQAIEKSKTDY